jgi:hypothetical protein
VTGRLLVVVAITALGLIAITPAAGALAIFGPPTALSGGPSSADVAVGDLNGDGIPDLVTANLDGPISVYLGTGAGGFARTDIAAGAIPISVAVADLNEDGRPDLIVANLTAPGTVTILLGTGGGAFGAPTSVAVGDFPRGLAVADLDRDGHLDLVVANTGSNSLSVRRGTGTGTFIAAPDVAIGTMPTGVAVGDLDRDGVPDLVVSQFFDNVVTVRRGLGAATFGAATAFPTPTGPRGVAVADLNRDGKPDVAVACQGAASVAVLLGTGTGSLGAFEAFPTGTQPLALAIAEVNDDGRLDVIVVDGGDATVSVLLGRGDGDLLPRVFLPSTALPSGSLAIADLDRDGRPDLVVAGAPGAVHLNEAVFAFDEQYAVDFTSGVLDAGVSPSFVALGDFNRDGKLDAAVANLGSPASLSIYLNSGLMPPTFSVFAAPTALTGLPSPSAIAVADLNRDGALDLVVSHRFDSKISILLGNGAGGFGAPSFITTGGFPGKAVVADVNGDGIPDVLVPCASTDTVVVLLGTGTGFFTAAPNLGTADAPLALAAGDLDGDGALDVVVVHNNFPATLSVFLGVGDGTFGPRADILTASPGPRAVVLADVTGDGRLDALVGTIDALVIHVGDGTGALPLTGSVPLSPTSDRGLIVADMDRNGTLDVVTSGDDPDVVTVLFGDGHGGFTAFSVETFGNDPQFPAVGDLDGDGQLDIVVANQFDDTISVVLGVATATLRVAGEGTGSGVIRSGDFGIECGFGSVASFTGCAAAYFPRGVGVTLTFEAEAGTIFHGWRGGGCTGTGPCVLAVNGAVEVTAVTEQLPPSTEGLIPEVAVAGVALSISVTGNNFTPATKIMFGGTLLTAETTFQSAVRLTATIAADKVLAPSEGPPQLTIRTCTPDLGCSTNSRILTLFTLIPSRAAAGLPGLALTVRGGIFTTTTPKSQIFVNGIGLATTLSDQFTAHATLPASELEFPGSPSIEVRHLLSVNNEASSPAMILEVEVDTSGPDVFVDLSEPFFTNVAALDLQGTASDDLSPVQAVSWSSDRGGTGGAAGTASWTITGLPLQIGTNLITVSARDAFDNVGTALRTVVYDPTPPAVTITSPTTSPSLATAASAVTLGGTAGDNGGTVHVTWVNDRGGSGNVFFAPSPWNAGTVPLQLGVNVITVTAFDFAGNSATDVLTVTRNADATPPTVTIQSPTTAATLLTTTPAVTLGGSAADDGTIAQVSWATDRGFSGGAAGTTAWTAAAVPLAVGRNVVTVTARDAADRTGTDTLVAFFFTDALGGAIPVKAQHFLELKAAIDQQRARASLPPLAWTQGPPKTGDPVRLSHLLDLRAALAVLFPQPPAFTDPAPTAGFTTIRAIHLNEVRQRVVDLQ